MPAPTPQPAAESADPAVRYRTVFVDWSKAGPALAERASQQRPAPPARTVVMGVDEQVASVRKNVQDAARAVLTWLASAVSHEDGLDLDAVLDACLRPGPDSQGINFNALTLQINQTLGTDLTAKRVRTAVRNAAGRLIDNDFGEGIPQSVDGPSMAERFESAGRRGVSRGRAFDRLLRTLRDCDGEPEADMRLVLDGARVIADLAGPGSLPGVMARLNVLVAGRYLLESAEYTKRLMALGAEAEALHGDAATKKLMRHARGLPEDQRLPSPLRVASYCRNNAATHLLDRLFDGRLTGAHHLATAERCIASMMQRDSGFRLLRVTRLIHAVTAAQLSGDDGLVDTLLTGWGEATTLAVLEDLARFDNNELVIAAGRHHARRVYPALARRVIRAA